MELCIDESDDRPILRNTESSFLLLVSRIEHNLLHLRSSQSSELRHVLHLRRLGELDSFFIHVRQLEKRRGRGMDTLENELLEMEDHDRRRQPVVRECDGEEGVRERKSEGDGVVLFCEFRQFESQRSSSGD